MHKKILELLHEYSWSGTIDESDFKELSEELHELINTSEIEECPQCGFIANDN